MERPISIAIGEEIVFGRDKIYLEHSFQKENQLTLRLEVELKDGPQFLEISFKGSIFFSVTELDTYEQSKWSSSWLTSQSNFDEILESDFLKERVNIRSDYHKEAYHHYRLCTYDAIFDIVATAYQIENNA